MCLRVLQVVGTMDRGGVETLLMSLYRKMKREQIQFDFVIHGLEKGVYEDEIQKLGGRTFHVPHYNGKNHFSYCRFWEKFFKEHPEYRIVHGHSRSTATIYLGIAHKYQRITIAHSHNTGSRGNKLEKFIKAAMQIPVRYVADYFLACSEKAGEWLFGKKVCRSQRFWILKNGIDSGMFLFRPDIRTKKREVLGIAENEFVIGHIGNFEQQKNHLFILQIFEKLLEFDKNCKLVLIGDVNSSMGKEVQKMINYKGISAQIQLLGSRSDVNELLNAFDVFLFPSKYEGLGIAAVEAQANGLHCILSDVIPREVKVSDRVHFLSLKDSAEVWAKEILKYRDSHKRKDTREDIKKQGYDIEETASWLACQYAKWGLGERHNNECAKKDVSQL